MENKSWKQIFTPQGSQKTVKALYSSHAGTTVARDKPDLIKARSSITCCHSIEFDYYMQEKVQIQYTCRF